MKIGEIITRFERRGYKLVAAKMMTPSVQLAKQHYAEHDGKPFFEPLVNFLTSGPVFAMVWEGKVCWNSTHVAYFSQLFEGYCCYW